MSQDSKAKIEYLRMRIMKLKQSRETFENEGLAGGGTKKGEESLESRIEELRHRLRIESACLEGAKNVLKLLQGAKVPDKKALQEVRRFLNIGLFREEVRGVVIHANLVILTTPERIISYQVVGLGHLGGFVAF